MNAIISRQRNLSSEEAQPLIERAKEMVKVVLKLKNDPSVEIHHHPFVKTDMSADTPLLKYTANSVLPKEDRLKFLTWTTSKHMRGNLNSYLNQFLDRVDRLLKSQDTDTEWKNARNELINRLKVLDMTVENLELKKRYWDVGFQRLLNLNKLPEYKMKTRKI